MKKIEIFIAATGVLLLGSFAASAQQENKLKFNLNYNYSMPQNAFKSDIISNNSARGITGGITYSFNPKWSAGLEVGYQDYYQKYPRDVYPYGKSQDISAVISNSVQTSPVLLKGTFSPFGNATSAIKPYLSVGAGLNIISYSQYLGEFGGNQTNAGFIAQGGLGVLIPFGKLSSSGLNVGADYDYAPYNKLGNKDLNSMNFHAGIYFPLK